MPPAGPAVIDVATECAPTMLERIWLCAPNWQSLLPLRGHGVKLVDSTRLSRIKEGARAPSSDAARRRHRRDQPASHRLERRHGGVVPPVRSGGVRLGHAGAAHLAGGLRMGLDGVFSDWVDRMIEVYIAEIGTPQ